MSTAIGDTLPLAIAAALSPLPLIALVLVLLSRRARSNGPAFLLGWIVGLALAEAIVLGMVSLLNLEPGSSPPTIVNVLKLVLGIVLLGLGINQWRQRIQKRGDPAVPGWMTSVDALSPAKAFGLAVLLSTAGNIALIVAGGLTIGRAKLNVGQEVGAASVFIVISSLTVITAVLYHLLGRHHATTTLDSLKVWLLANHGTLTSTLFVVVGVLLLGKGISGLGLLG